MIVDFLFCLEGHVESDDIFCYAIAAGGQQKIMGGDEVIEKRNNFGIILRYPFYTPVCLSMRKEGGNWTKQEFADAVSRKYLEEWEADKENFKNHTVGDLYLEYARLLNGYEWVVDIGS